MKYIGRMAMLGLLLSLLGLGALTSPALAAGTAAPGYNATDFATGFTSNGAVGPVGLAFDSSNQLWVANYATGTLYRFPAGGGIASPATQVGPVGGVTGQNDVAGIAFTKSGRLYAALQATGAVVELSTVNGHILRFLANVPCATGLATDPLSGDLFATTIGCGSSLIRISDPDSVAPPVSVYANYGSTDGITFGPNGTIYTETNVCATKVAGTDQPSPPAVTVLPCVSSMDGIAVATSSDPSKPPFIYTNNNDGSITKVDLSTSPPTQTQIVTGGSRGDFVTVGPDGCLYATQTDSIEKVTNADGSCSLAPTGVVPALSLSASTTAAHTGTSVTLTATFQNLIPPDGTTVTFTITGANGPQTLTAPAFGGIATVPYTGTFTGTDSITATATDEGTPVTSNTVSIIWDNTAPTCSLKNVTTDPSNGHKMIVVAMQDGNSGLGSIKVAQLVNSTLSPYQTSPVNTVGQLLVGIPVGSTAELDENATKVNTSLGSQVGYTVKDEAGNSTTCDPVMTSALRSTGAPSSDSIAGIGSADHLVHVYNDQQGVESLTVTVNGKSFALHGLSSGQKATLEIGSALQSSNQVSVTTTGKPGGSATVLFGNI